MNRISKRELQVLERISMGDTAKEIAQKLYLSEHTINTHKKRLLNKMNAINSPDMVRKGFEIGVLKSQTSF